MYFSDLQKVSEILCSKKLKNFANFPTHVCFLAYQVVKIAEDVNAEESRADGEDVKVKLMVWQHAGVPKILFSKFLD